MDKQSIGFHSPPEGEAYRRLIGEMCRRTPAFMVAVREMLHRGERCNRVVESLRPYLIDMRSYAEVNGRNEIGYTDGVYLVYRCCPETAGILAASAEGLYDWIHPELPEDLCFIDKNGNDVLATVAHESIGYVRMDVDKARRLSEEAPGVFLELPEHRTSIDDFLQNAYRHRSRHLVISGFGIDRIPEEIAQLRSLKELVVFEEKVRALPPALFRLEGLERLVIETVDLDEIPSAIGRLRSLRELIIRCGCSLRPGASVISKKDVAIDRLPPELGELRSLERLTINYTAIRRLPEELRQLAKLQALDASDNLIEETPAWLSELPNLRGALLYRNPCEQET